MCVCDPLPLYKHTKNIKNKDKQTVFDYKTLSHKLHRKGERGKGDASEQTNNLTAAKST